MPEPLKSKIQTLREELTGRPAPESVFTKVDDNTLIYGQPFNENDAENSRIATLPVSERPTQFLTNRTIYFLSEGKSYTGILSFDPSNPEEVRRHVEDARNELNNPNRLGKVADITDLEKAIIEKYKRSQN